jgi:hypothetical protein
VALVVERVRPFRDRLRLAGESLRVAVLSAVGVDARLHLPPQHLREQVLLVAEFAAELRERLRLVVAAERAQRAAELRREGRKVGPSAPSLEPVALSAQVGGRSRVVSGERGDLAEVAVSLAQLSREESAELTRALDGRTSERPGFLEAA